MTLVYRKLGDLMDLLSLVNSSANFVIYFAMSQKFREVFRLTVVPFHWWPRGLVGGDSHLAPTHDACGAPANGGYRSLLAQPSALGGAQNGAAELRLVAHQRRSTTLTTSLAPSSDAAAVGAKRHGSQQRLLLDAKQSLGYGCKRSAL